MARPETIPLRRVWSFVIGLTLTGCSPGPDRPRRPSASPTTETDPTTTTNTTSTSTTPGCVLHTDEAGTVTDLTEEWATGTEGAPALLAGLSGTYEVCEGTWYVGLRALGSLTVIGTGPGPVVLNKSGRGPVIHMGIPGGDLVVENVTITEGNIGQGYTFGGGVGPVGGGGILCTEGGNLTVRQTVFEANQGSLGSAIYAHLCGDILIEDSSFTQHGPGMTVYAHRPRSFSLLRSDFSDNEGTNVYVTPVEATFEDLTITGGEVGLYLWGGISTLSNVQIRDALAGVQSHYDDITIVDSTLEGGNSLLHMTSAHSLVVERSVFRSSTGAANWAPLWLETDDFGSLTDVEIEHNVAVGRPPVRLSWGAWTWDRVTLTSNTTDDVAAVDLFGTALTCTDCAFSGNTPEGIDAGGAVYVPTTPDFTCDDLGCVP